MRETKRKATIVSAWKKEPYNAQAWNIPGTKELSGMPDTLLIKDRLHIWIEFKGKGTAVQDNQSAVQRMFSKEGIHVFVVRFVDDSLWIIDEKYEIKMRQLRFGIKLLFDTLISLAKSNVSKSIETTLNVFGG